MTSAALADCHGAISDSASRAKTKRTVFMQITPVQWAAQSRLQHQPVTKYRSRMKVLRHPAAMQHGVCLLKYKKSPAARKATGRTAKSEGAKAPAPLVTREALHQLYPIIYVMNFLQ